MRAGIHIHHDIKITLSSAYSEKELISGQQRNIKKKFSRSKERNSAQSTISIFN